MRQESDYSGAAMKMHSTKPGCLDAATIAIGVRVVPQARERERKAALVDFKLRWKDERNSFDQANKDLEAGERQLMY